MIDKTRLYTVSDLAKEFGITPRAIRHYEDQKLLSPQRVGGNRVFDYRDKARLQLILRLKGVGFMLKDIKEYIDLYDVDEHQVTQLKMGFSSICARIEDIEGQISQLQNTLKELIELKNDAVTLLHERGVDTEEMRLFSQLPGSKLSSENICAD